MPLPPEELFDSDDEPSKIWHENEWIGTGKKYPSDDTPCAQSKQKWAFLRPDQRIRTNFWSFEA
ncbi:hypothetical protein L208DRAFT_1392660 [Tricholoma matsutake]|nr:hypothetical protein L208DRAFT_1392660 [Tricholoma matsutake 945]